MEKAFCGTCFPRRSQELDLGGRLWCASSVQRLCCYLAAEDFFFGVCLVVDNDKIILGEIVFYWVILFYFIFALLFVIFVVGLIFWGLYILF